MKDLIARLEKATGSDRGIDLDIARMLGVTVMRRNDADTGNEEYTHWRYTASLDDALTLVPEGWTRAVDATAPELGIDVDLFLNGPRADMVVHGTHASEPIATCLAALSALRSSRSLPDTEGKK